MTTKRTPSEATLRTKAYGKVARLEAELERRRAAFAKARQKHEDAIAKTEKLLAEARTAFEAFTKQRIETVSYEADDGDG